MHFKNDNAPYESLILRKKKKLFVKDDTVAVAVAAVAPASNISFLNCSVEIIEIYWVTESLNDTKHNFFMVFLKLI